MGKVSAHGFVSYATDGSPTYLPLKSVSAKIYIVDVSARVVLTQLYTNDHTFKDCASAQYIFPVPANGAVCAFKMQTTDGRVVKGVVKERSKAEQEFEMALSQNQFAGLLFEATPDIFVISIGAIPEGQDMEVTTMYVIALSDGDLPGYDQVEFSLPTYIATRYGTPPAALTGPSSSSTHTSLDISAEIQMPTSITSVTSSSHAIKVYTTNVTSSPSPIYTSRVTLDPASPPPKLTKPFVLSIHAAKLGQPRCVAEVRTKEMSVALSLTFVPRFRMRALPTQEYVFLVDRSGSMAGERIRHAKEALLLFLKSLPSQGTLFNIFSFGSSSSSLWPSSRKYTATDINIALSHVSAMDANMGGTEIQSGLANTLRSRNPSVPMAVFVLTDGEVYNLDSLLTLVSNEVAKSRTPHNGAQTQTHLRIFTLGVGDSASTALCEGIARNGNGLCLMASEGGDISQKCARLLLASKMAPSGNANDIVIDWGYVPASHSSSSSKGNGNAQSAYSTGNKGKITILYDESCDPLKDPLGHRRIILPDPPSIQQAPSRVPDLYPANRFTVSAILSNTLIVPRTVTLCGTLPDGSIISLPPIKVCLALDPQGQRKHVGDLPPLIHTLAAHRIIQELEDGNTDSQGVFDRGDKALCEVVAREAIVRLSERYQLASKFASFIAVEGADDDDVDDDKDVNVGVNNGDDTQGNKAGKQRSAAANADADSDDDSDDDFYDNDDDVDASAKPNTAPNINVNARGYSAGGWPGVEPCDPPAQAVNPASNPAHPQPSGASATGIWGSTTPSSNPCMPASQQSKKDAASSLPPLVVDPGVPSNTSTSQRSTQTSHFVNAFTSPNHSGNGASHHTTAPIQRSASTRSGGGVYLLDTVANKDAIEGRSSRHGMRMPGAYPIDDTSSSLRARDTVASGRIANWSDPLCPSQKMPGAYPHRTVLLSGGGADRLTVTPSSGQRRSRTTLTPYPLRNRPQSILYTLETATCVENAVKIVHFDLDQIDDSGEEEEEVASPPLFTVTASSKTGLYRAPKKSSKPTAIAPVLWTTGAPIIAAARLQSFDGSFELNDDLHALIGKKVSLERLKTVIPARLKGQLDADKIWATVLVAAYLKKALPDDKEVWIGLWNKAAEYVEMQLGTAGVSFAALVNVASKLL